MYHLVDFSKNLLLNFRIVDAIDILLLSFTIYWVITLIKGTRAIYMVFGLSIGLILVWLSSIKNYELFTLNSILRIFFNNLPLIIIVLFQSEIRRLLTQIGKGPFFSQGLSYAGKELIEDLVKTSVSLANKKIGALIVLEREADLTDYLETGVLIDAKVSKDLLTSIFLPVSPIHDGAVIIQKGRISKAACFLPLTMNPQVSKDFGTRHRAAIGISEEVDSVVIVISEERGAISAVVSGRITENLDAKTLRMVLQNLLNPSTTEKIRKNLLFKRLKFGGGEI